MKLQPKHQKIFEQIAPQWNYIIKKANCFADLSGVFTRVDNPNKELSIGSFSCCIAGEIYCFTSDYEDYTDPKQCPSCRYLSVKFMNIIDNAKWKEITPVRGLYKIYEQFQEEFSSNIDNFVEHLQEKHPQIISQKTQEYRAISEMIDKAIKVPKLIYKTRD